MRRSPLVEFAKLVGIGVAVPIICYGVVWLVLVLVQATLPAPMPAKLVELNHALWTFLACAWLYPKTLPLLRKQFDAWTRAVQHLDY